MNITPQSYHNPNLDLFGDPFYISALALTTHHLQLKLKLSRVACCSSVSVSVINKILHTALCTLQKHES
jgi:hypothetical protein